MLQWNSGQDINKKAIWLFWYIISNIYRHYQWLRYCLKTLLKAGGKPQRVITIPVAVVTGSVRNVTRQSWSLWIYLDQDEQRTARHSLLSVSNPHKITLFIQTNVAQMPDGRFKSGWVSSFIAPRAPSKDVDSTLNQHWVNVLFFCVRYFRPV